LGIGVFYNRLPHPQRKVAIYVALLIVIRGPFCVFFLMQDWGPRDAPLWVLGPVILASPFTFALAARYFVQRNLRGFGWKPGRLRYVAAGWLLPVLIAGLVYGGAWLSGAVEFKAGAEFDIPAMLLQGALITLGLLIPTLFFEELGWRGLLVPEMSRFMSFTRLALLTGAIWALFHYPWLLSPVYAKVPPTFWSVSAFTIGIVAASFPLAWLTLKSGSLWPAVLFHACHNAFVNDVLEKSFIPASPSAAAFLGESGYGMAIGYLLLAFWCWRNRHLVERLDPSGPPPLLVPESRPFA
jgi:membrane protease YdiL (CAAX protease family)